RALTVAEPHGLRTLDVGQRRAGPDIPSLCRRAEPGGCEHHGEQQGCGLEQPTRRPHRALPAPSLLSGMEAGAAGTGQIGPHVDLQVLSHVLAISGHRLLSFTSTNAERGIKNASTAYEAGATPALLRCR